MKAVVPKHTSLKVWLLKQLKYTLTSHLRSSGFESMQLAANYIKVIAQLYDAYRDHYREVVGTLCLADVRVIDCLHAPETHYRRAVVKVSSVCQCHDHWACWIVGTQEAIKPSSGRAHFAWTQGLLHVVYMGSHQDSQHVTSFHLSWLPVLSHAHTAYQHQPKTVSCFLC